MRFQTHTVGCDCFVIRSTNERDVNRTVLVRLVELGGVKATNWACSHDEDVNWSGGVVAHIGSKVEQGRIDGGGDEEVVVNQ